MKRFWLFALTMAVMIGLFAAAAVAVLGPRIGESGSRAIVMSAGIAFTVQCLTFGIARAIMPMGLWTGWGAAVGIRAVTLIMHGFVGVPLLGLDAAPALLSLAAFFLMTSVIEPFFLISRHPLPPPQPPAPPAI
jgi:hypothetical protein